MIIDVLRVIVASWCLVIIWRQFFIVASCVFG